MILYVIASYPIVRGRGHFGNVSVLWVLEPNYSGDVTPVQGEVVFAEGEYLKNLTLFSKPDEVNLFKMQPSGVITLLIMCRHISTGFSTEIPDSRLKSSAP